MLFCSGASDTCFVYSTIGRDFVAARADCMRQKGEVFMPRSAGRQLMVGRRTSGPELATLRPPACLVLRRAESRQQGSCRANAVLIPSLGPAPLQVETYFSNSTALTKQSYWLGIQQASAGAVYAYVDGSAVLQNASNVPYAHWGHVFSGRLGLGLGCVAARASLAYDFYLGDRSQQARPEMYQTTGTSDTK